MSSQQKLGLIPPFGEINHIQTLSEHLGSLLQGEYYDVMLFVDGETLPAHKVILASRSEYFRALFYGGLCESQQSEVELRGINGSAFKILLRYIYTGCVNLCSLKEGLVRDLLGLAHQYAFPELEQAISDYLKSVLSVNNVCQVYDVANLYQLKSLTEECRNFADQHAADILSHDSFLLLSPGTVCDLLQRDSFCAPEVEIFRSVVRWWQQYNTDGSSNLDELASVLNSVRLPLLSLTELINEVRPTSLVSADAILDALKVRTESRDSDLPYRGNLLPEVNVAHIRHGGAVLQGEMRAALLDGDTANYDMERGFTRHPIEEGNSGIVVRLGQPYIINHVRILLWDRDNRSYSYYVEVSMDQRDWVRVTDHSKYHCRSWQRLFFPARVVRFIRVVGTHNTVNKVFHAVALEAYYSTTPFLLHNGLLVPKHNVATIQLSACVLEGVSRSRNALLNGDTRNYDWDSGYTCHQLGSGAIVVQLPQPFIVDSMRLLLWDCDDRRYSYRIEISVNNREWTVVCDRSRQPCQSWQMIRFAPVPVVYVKIVGTHNTANDVFHCVHFECPAIEDATTEEVASTASTALVANEENPAPLPIFPPVSEASAEPPSVQRVTWNAAPRSRESDEQDSDDEAFMLRPGSHRDMTQARARLQR